MNTTEYADYERRVSRFLEDNHVEAGCHGASNPDASPFFSWRQCGCCGSRKGGDRETFCFAVEQGEPFETDVCGDCVQYLAYGQLDDLTMFELGRL